MMLRPFTGWHMLALMVAFFGVVAAVNFTMARIAIGSFGGVVVENSYIASQEFNGWLEQAEAQKQLGWEVSVQRGEDGRIIVSVGNAPDLVEVSASARHPLGQGNERVLVFERLSAGEYVSTQVLPAGRWTMRLQLQSGDDTWRSEEALQ